MQSDIEAAQPFSRRRRDLANSGHPSIAGLMITPGASLLRRHPLLAAVLLLGGVVAPVVAVVMLWAKRDTLADFALRSSVLQALVIVGAMFLATRVVAVVLEATYQQSQRTLVGGLVTVALLTVPVGFGMLRLRQVDDVVSTVFTDAGSDPLVVAAADPTGAEYETVLLLGGDEGPGRFGLRTDTMILVITHRASGRAAMVSVPRNLAKLQFPPGTPMADEYPDGFDDLANAVYPTVFGDSNLLDQYERGDLEAAALALMDGISYSLGLTIDDYVLINMLGFLELIDAVGGVTIELDTELPMPGNIPGAKHQVTPTIGPGVVSMDGTVALGYVRSRGGDSDYQRMERQRILLTNLAQQAQVRTILTQFGSFADALEETVRTSMSPEGALALAQQLQGGSMITTSIGLVPPLFDPERPDYDDLRVIIDDVRESLRTGVAFEVPVEE